MLKNLLFLVCLINPLAAYAQLVPINKLPPGQINWQVSQPFCFLVDSKQQVADLIEMCGKVDTSASFSGSPASSTGGFASGGSSGSQCQFATDLASDGSKCGARAASQKPGG